MTKPLTADMANGHINRYNQMASMIEGCVVEMTETTDYKRRLELQKTVVKAVHAMSHDLGIWIRSNIKE